MYGRRVGSIASAHCSARTSPGYSDRMMGPLWVRTRIPWPGKDRGGRGAGGGSSGLCGSICIGLRSRGVETVTRLALVLVVALRAIMERESVILAIGVIFA